MTGSSPESRSKSSWLWVASMVALLLVVGFLIRNQLLQGPLLRSTEPELSADVVEQFFVGVAALEVEENQRAAEIFQQLSGELAEEPAIWANRGIALLRLNENSDAEHALQMALELAPENSEILLLNALADERSGDFESAISRLDQLPSPSPAALNFLSELIERTGVDDATQRRNVINQHILRLAPENLVAQFDRARLVAKLEQAEELQDSLQVLAKQRDQWDELALEQFNGASEAVEKGDFRSAGRYLTFLENLSKRSPLYQAGLVTLGRTSNSVGTPIAFFLKYELPQPAIAAADTKLTYVSSEDALNSTGDNKFQKVWGYPLDGENISLISLQQDKISIGDNLSLSIPEGTELFHSSLALIDLNNDFLSDIVFASAAGLKVWIQNENHDFTELKPNDDFKAGWSGNFNGVWGVDIEADGDLDIILSSKTQTSVLRNNGDLTFTQLGPISDLAAIHDLHVGDFDNDGDQDLVVLTSQGNVKLLWNERSGKFSESQDVDSKIRVLAIGVADLSQDGVSDLAILGVDGELLRYSWNLASNDWSQHSLARLTGLPKGETLPTANASLQLQDLDNNGGLDIAVCVGESTFTLLRESDNSFQLIESPNDIALGSIIDTNGDGLLDLVGVRNGKRSILSGQGEKNYGWHVVRPRANPNPGDKRINSFGISGRIESRSGRQVQTLPIKTPFVHLGLGQNQRVAVARIIWPNGTIQAEFELVTGEATVANQRLKGSCPWVFAVSDEGIRFVKDFIWRSPLGLKINSQDTAGVSQTEDWIKIPGEMLTAINKTYEVRITADLWETHFFDHVSLMVVDHPDDAEVLIDERFVPNANPELQPLAMSKMVPLRSARDETGQDVSELLQDVDQRTVDSFELGEFQGVASDHWIEFELDETLPEAGEICLVGHGWIYPTDSSLNVAISQGRFSPPYGLILEVPVPGENGSDEEWKAVSGDLGFPAGKNKTVVLPLPADELASGQRRFRLRTNLEIYWDKLAVAAKDASAEFKVTRLEAGLADLRYRGFSEYLPTDRRRPDLPNYQSIAETGAKWRDLEGYYTRFGDVKELLQDIDDRYVIMNAGDEMILQFPELPAPQSGWTRDFVLIGDGWVKDGDLNTTFSRTVHPLPSHSSDDYANGAVDFWQDPVFLKHIEDWKVFHTRYVPGRSDGTSLTFPVRQ